MPMSCADCRPSCRTSLMHEEVTEIRQHVVEHVEMLASAGDQLRYERDVPIASVPDELVCGFTDDLFAPKWRPFVDAFTESELKSLAGCMGGSASQPMHSTEAGSSQSGPF